MSKEIINLEVVRAKLAAGRGRQQWRSLDELADTYEFQDMLAREFPREAAEWNDPVSRRAFLKLMGASLALAGLTSCQYALQQPQEQIIPYVRLPEQEIPGRPLFYATARVQGGYGTGVLAEQHEGRPTKLEGNPDHPASLGASDVFLQASALTMYDPERSQRVLYQKQPSTWNDFSTRIAEVVGQQRSGGGAGLRILTETVTSPTLAGQLQALLQAFPSAKWVQYDPISQDNVRAGAQLAFGSPAHTVYRFDQAEVVVALDADFMFTFPGHLRYSRDFINKRRVREGAKTMNRLYVAEGTPTITGSLADHRLPVRPSQIAALAQALARGVGVQGVAEDGELPEGQRKWVEALIKDVQAQPGTSIVVAGEQQPPAVHALCHAINAALQNVGKTVSYTAPVEALPSSQFADLQTLASEMDGGQVQALFIIGANPVFTAPADLAFGDKLAKVPVSVHLGLYEDETADKTTWHINEAHFLETWGDVRAFDGTASIIQPLIAPLYGGKSPHELLDTLAGQNRSGHDLVQAHWQTQITGADFQGTWNVALRDGVLPNTAAAPATVTLKTGFDTAVPAVSGEYELVLRPDPSIWDGSFANNGWLMELPRPFTKVAWDNVALVSPATAQKLGVQTEDVVELKVGNGTVKAPIWILPGQAEGAVTVHLGYGRTKAGSTGTGVGFNAYALRTTANPWFSGGLQVTKTGEKYTLVSTQSHFSIDKDDRDANAAAERRDLVQQATFEKYLKNPDVLHHEHAPISLHPKYPYTGYAWGMTIDQTACIGCNACVVACQSENNIATVGKDQIGRGREMHWIRIDQYYQGSLDNPKVLNQPLLCMQCEQAPCEIVCPVAATVHDAEGLNNMVYNRCVGTKYCSNNCPYKVRRFNFLQYSDQTTPSLKMQRNPNVTVRIKGVMEKCTYCTQRITSARQDAERQGRQIRDGEVVTACQQACPTNAIVFGNINDPNSEVAKLKKEPTNYSLLAELNTSPRTTYLARISNPNPELGEAGGEGHAE